MIKVKMEDFTGRKFGRWTVLKFDDERSAKGKGKYWSCQCECELKTIRSVSNSSLKDGSSLSCGCYNKEQTKKMIEGRKTTNKYDLSGEYGIGYTVNGDKFLFDLEDYDLIKDYKWNINKLRSNCVQANTNRTTIKMHRLILGLTKGEIADHINRDESDNRKENLRKCTFSENGRNKLTSLRNTSGHKGIHESKSGYRYEAYISDINGKRIRKMFYFTTYSGKENAYKCACEWYEEMDKRISGEFSVYN